MPFGSLLAALAEVRDPRRAQGQRYSMRHLLLFSVLAVLTGATSYQGIITFIGVVQNRPFLGHTGARRAPAYEGRMSTFDVPGAGGGQPPPRQARRG